MTNNENELWKNIEILLLVFKQYWQTINLVVKEDDHLLFEKINNMIIEKPSQPSNLPVLLTILQNYDIFTNIIENNIWFQKVTNQMSASFIEEIDMIIKNYKAALFKCANIIPVICNNLVLEDFKNWKDIPEILEPFYFRIMLNENTRDGNLINVNDFNKKLNEMIGCKQSIISENAFIPGFWPRDMSLQSVTNKGISITGGKFVSKIMVNSSGMTPIEFNVQALIDNKFVLENGLNVPITNGLNKKILQRYDTAKVLGLTSKFAEKSIVATGEVGGENSQVFETLDGVNYRDNGKTNFYTSWRPECYGNLSWQIIKLVCFDDKIANMAKNFAPISVDAGASKIYSQIMEFIDNKYINANDYDIREQRLIFNDRKEVLQNFIREIVGNNAPSHSELICSYIVQLEEFIGSFKRALQSHAGNLKLRGNMRRSEVVDIFRELMKTILDELRRSEGGIIFGISESLKEYIFMKK